MLRWGDARAEAHQVGRAPVWGRPRNKGGPVAVQPCCLPEHKQHSPRSVSGRYPGDTRVSGSVYGQRAGKPVTNGACSLPWATHVPTWTPTCDPAIYVYKTHTRYVCICFPHMPVHGTHEYMQPYSNVHGQCVHGRLPPVDTCVWYMWKHPAVLRTRFSFFKLQSPILGSVSESKSQLPN